MSNPWFYPLGHQLTYPRLRLLCFPYAGGDIHSYRNWAKLVPPDIQLIGVQLPGRGRRLSETPNRDLRHTVRQLLVELKPWLHQPFAFFGHSMGALLSFELAHSLRAAGLSGPEHLFVSGRSAPHVPDSRAPLHDMPEPEFINELKKYNGTPQEVFDSRELLDLVLPTLRADFEMVETYEFRTTSPLDIPITAFGGSHDPEVPLTDLSAWKIHTQQQFSERILEGDHFFINSHASAIVQQIFETLSSAATAPLFSTNLPHSIPATSRENTTRGY